MRGSTSQRKLNRAREPSPDGVEARGGAEAALRESEQRLRAIVETAVDAIITIDERGRIESVNPATEKLFGYKRRELIGRSVGMLMPEPYRGSHDEYLNRYLATGRARIIGVGREVVGLRKDGQRFPLHLSVSEVRLERGRLFTAILHDATQRRRLEREVLEAGENEQRRIGQELHDGICQNLLGAALGLSVLANQLERRSPVEAAELNRLAALVRQTATEARDLSHSLAPLDVAADGLVPAVEKFAAYVREVFRIRCDLYAEPGGVPNGLSLGPGAAPNGLVSGHLYRIVQEAVNNAIRHGKATQVEIRLITDASGLRLTIHDNGRGFPKRPGKGLGLQTMMYRARVIGGTLSIDRARGGGMVVSCAIHWQPESPAPRVRGKGVA